MDGGRKCLVASALAMLVACGPGSGRAPTQSPHASVVASTLIEDSPSPAGTVTAGDEVTITEKDSGKTFIFSTSTRGTLSLSDDLLWKEPKVDGTAIRSVPVESESATGSKLWRIQVVSKGTASIATTGAPNCPKGSPCPAYLAAFEVTIEVR